MASFFDIALGFDPDARAFDIALGPDGDLVVDETPATAMLVSLGIDRRAAPDDELPAGRDATFNGAPPGFVTRRGFSGDAGQPAGPRTGSRIWLLDRAKQDEITRMRIEDWAREALAWATSVTGRPAAIEATWLRRGVLSLTARIDATEITVARNI